MDFVGLDFVELDIVELDFGELDIVELDFGEFDFVKSISPASFCSWTKEPSFDDDDDDSGTPVNDDDSGASSSFRASSPKLVDLINLSFSFSNLSFSFSKLSNLLKSARICSRIFSNLLLSAVLCIQWLGLWRSLGSDLAFLRPC